MMDLSEDIFEAEELSEVETISENIKARRNGYYERAAEAFEIEDYEKVFD